MATLTEEIKRNVGQHFVVGFHGYEPSNEIRTLIRDYFVGNVILFKRNVQSAKQTRELIRNLQLIAKEGGHSQPLLIGIDQENGLVSAFSSPTAGTQFPGAMGLAATGSLHLAEEVSRASASELRSVGINWAYSPVADVNTDSRNPVIGVRSFGDDPQKVGGFAVAVGRGLRSAGVAPTAKHFPGHGDTHIDSHLALPVIMKSKEQLAQEELVPFQQLIDSGIPCIMTGHMALPLITGAETPCSLSAEITHDLLRGDMGFTGVVVTDCLEMDAIANPAEGGCGVEEGALRSIKAGADIAMICHTYERQKGAIETIYRAIEGGDVLVDALDQSQKRIAEMKAVFAKSWGDILGIGDDWETEFRKVQAGNLILSREAYGRSISVVWNGDNENVIPLELDLVEGEKSLLLLTPIIESVNKAVDSDDGVVRNRGGASFIALAQALERKVGVDHVVYRPGGRPDDVITDNTKAVVFVMLNADLKRWQLDQLASVWQKVDEAKLPMVLISSCGPYDLADERGNKYRRTTGYLMTYEFTAEAFEGVSEVLFGEVSGRGRVPVSHVP